MGVTIDWGSTAQNIIVIAFVKPWNWDDFYNAYTSTREMIESVDHMVDLVADFTRSGILPLGGLTHLGKVTRNPHPRRGVIVVVASPTTFAEALMNILGKVNPQSINQARITSTIEQAYAIIAELQAQR